MGGVAEATCRRAQQPQRVLPGHWGWQCNDGGDAVCSRRGDAAKRIMRAAGPQQAKGGCALREEVLGRVGALAPVPRAGFLSGETGG